jgi:hypothetical protein
MDTLFHEIFVVLDRFFMTDEWDKLSTHTKLDLFIIYNKVKAKVAQDIYFEDIKRKYASN